MSPAHFFQRIFCDIEEKLLAKMVKSSYDNVIIYENLRKLLLT